MEPKPNQVDLVKLGKELKVAIQSHEQPQELESRLRREEADADLQRRKDLALFWAAIAGASIIVILCVFLVVRPDSSADDKKWATAVLASIVSAAVGVIVGKNSK
jgi:hypothetical protein